MKFCFVVMLGSVLLLMLLAGWWHISPMIQLVLSQGGLLSPQRQAALLVKE